MSNGLKIEVTKLNCKDFSNRNVPKLTNYCNATYFDECINEVVADLLDLDIKTTGYRQGAMYTFDLTRDLTKEIEGSLVIISKEIDKRKAAASEPATAAEPAAKKAPKPKKAPKA